MGYMHIDNLYKNKDILLFKECYALEKIHGTSAHISWSKTDGLKFFAGGANHEQFIQIFGELLLGAKFSQMDIEQVTIYGEAYGGKLQGMSKTYGKDLRFVAFDVKIGDNWLEVPNAESLVRGLGLDFVHYTRTLTDLPALDALRDAPSEQARRLGLEDQKAEGVVLRPLMELVKKNGGRIIAKYKRDDFMETKTPRSVDADRLAVMQKAEEIAAEWVTPMRLVHVMDFLASAAARGGLPFSHDVKDTGLVIREMQEDILRESKGELEWSKDAERAVGTATAKIYKQKVKEIVQ